MSRNGPEVKKDKMLIFPGALAGTAVRKPVVRAREDGELMREWTVNTKLRSEARALLAKADSKLDAEDHAGALGAYIDAVKADRVTVDLEAIRRYAQPTFGRAPWLPPPPPTPPPGARPPNVETAPPPHVSAEATAAHIAALRQFLDIHPGHADAELDLVVILPAAEAETFVSEMVKTQPHAAEIYRLRSQVRFRAGQYVDALAEIGHATTLDPENAELFYALGVLAYEMVGRQPELAAEQKRDLIRRGLAAFDVAESLRADYVQSMVYHGLLLREQVRLESDPAVQRKVIEEADALRQRAAELVQPRRGPRSPADTEVKPAARSPIGNGAIRVGGAVRAPLVWERVEPVIPEAARKARITGIVIVEVVIDKAGRVADARVLKPLPFGLSKAALEAVRQWTFKPGMLSGEPVDVIYNVTVKIKVE